MSRHFLSRKPRARTSPQHDRTAVPVYVTAAERERPVIDNEPEALAFDPDPDTAATIRTHLWLQRNAREGQQ
jgi:hypothetical protein